MMVGDPSCDAAQQKLEKFLRHQVNHSGQSICLNQHDVLFEANDVSDGLYLIKQGRIKVFIRNPAGDQIELAVLQKGALIGEMSLFGEAGRSASCSALDPSTELLAIPRDTALEIIERDEEARHALIMILSQRSRSMVRFIHDFSNMTSLVADGNYTGVHALINSLGNPDPAVRSAREAFKLMLSRVQAREATLQSTVATLSLEIDRQRAAREVASVMESSLFQDLQKNASELRRKLKE
jgi:CRP-like cAMP-binding protein